MKISLGYSTCPNDTFMFDAIAHKRIETDGIEYEIVMADIFHLNQMALKGELDMVKISYNTFGKVRNSYDLLDAGSALGHNCGPLLISKEKLSVEEILERNLPVGIPGANTTANLLLGYFAPKIQHKKEFIFDEIMPAILEDKVAAGVIIHENRFTYQKMGLQLIQDLGEYWESKTGLPIPLGAIVAKKSLGEELFQTLQKHMRESVNYAFTYPSVSMPYVREHAQEMEDEVMQAHIDLYVNEFSLSLGEKGRKAVDKVLEVGEGMGLYA
ncbi:MAG: 1,4-dihydroxy-6-naphthoate synthase [Bacteroidota bacterium]